MWKNLVVVLAVALFSCPAIASDRINLEERRLKQHLDRQKTRCVEGNKQSANDARNCVQDAERRFKENMDSLRQDPELYFYELEGKMERREIRREVRRELDARGIN